MTQALPNDEPKERVHVVVAKQIAVKILSGEIAEQEKLPSEPDLCNQFGLSRTALRESMKLLSAKGLICSKPKIGTKVETRDKWHFLDAQLLDWIQETKKMDLFLHQFLGLRKALEPEACALASLNATAEQRMELSVIFQEMVTAAKEHNMANWIEFDLKFHCLLFRSTCNFFFIPLGNVLPTIFRTFIDTSAQGGRFCIEEHGAIYDAIMAGNPTKARLASKTLLDDENQRLSLVASSA